MKEFIEVKCIRGDEEIGLKEGHLYRANLTKKGNYDLLELAPPEPYTSFDPSRFEPTGVSYDWEDIFGEFYDDRKSECEDCEDYLVYLNSINSKPKDNGDTDEGQS